MRAYGLPLSWSASPKLIVRLPHQLRGLLSRAAIPSSLARSNVLTILAQHREPGKFQARHQCWRQQDRVGRGGTRRGAHRPVFLYPDLAVRAPRIWIVDTSIGRDHVYRDGAPGVRAARAWAELEVVRARSRNGCGKPVRRCRPFLRRRLSVCGTGAWRLVQTPIQQIWGFRGAGALPDGVKQ